MAPVSPEDLDEHTGEHAEETGAWIRRLEDPRAPGAEEAAEHAITHVPYRSWCEHCVRGRGRSMAHRRQEDKTRTMPEVHVDYCFVGSASDAGTLLTILVAVDRDSRMTMSAVVPRKGSTGAFAARRLNAFIKELGCEFVDITVKSDQEPALVSLIEDVRRLRTGARTFVEHSPVGASPSNGVVERAIQTVEGQLRTMKSALEHRWRKAVPDNHAVLTWMTEHASVLLNKAAKGDDGKTPHERLRGKKATLIGVEFGEGVFFRTKPSRDRLAKLECMWEHGIYLGQRAASGESVVGCASGVVKTRTIKRKPEEDRWD